LEIDSLDSRKKVAREAASLLYFGTEKEYKQAKIKASRTFGLHYLPTNLEVAMELDRIAEENEGAARQERLVRMRNEALNLMKMLTKFDPLLVGSVWRGTIHRESDIDIIVHHDEPSEILKMLKQNSFNVLKSERTRVTKHGKRKDSFHIHIELPTKEEAEIIVHSPEEACLKEKCEVYGDDVVGLHVKELERILSKNPIERFVPK
jgi:predicted nucleotidyltransferase